MSIENAIEEAVRKAVAPLEKQVKDMRGELAQMSERLPPQKPVSVKEAARHFGKSEKTIRRWIDSGELATVPHGRRKLIDLTKSSKSYDRKDVAALVDEKIGLV